MNIKIHSKKKIPENILNFLTAVPIKLKSEVNSIIELIPGPKVIPKALTKTNIVEYLL